MRRKKLVRPSMRKGWNLTRGDLGAIGFVCMMAVGAMFLPIDVYINPDQYSAPKMVFSRQRAGGDDAQLAYMAGGRALFDLEAKQFLPASSNSGIDFTTTGTVQSASKPAKQNMVPSVISKNIELLASDPKRALVIDGDGIYLVRPQSRLPGGGHVKALSNETGKKRLNTTRFEIVQSAEIN